MAKSYYKKDFSLIPDVTFNRSKFDLSSGKKTSMSLGRLYPLDITEVLPGDSFKGKLTAVVKCSSAFLKPIIDNMYLDLFHFFVPYRLVCSYAEEVFGVASPSSYFQDNLEEFPCWKSEDSVTPKSITISEKTIGDYLGLPLGTYNLTGNSKISLLPFRAFAKIYDEWFRNENVTDEIYVNTGDIVQNEEPNNLPFSPTNYCGQLPFVTKKADYFTSCLPNTQKGVASAIPITGLASLSPQANPYKWSPLNRNLQLVVNDNETFTLGHEFPITGVIGRSSSFDDSIVNLQVDGDNDLGAVPTGSLNKTIIGTNLKADLSTAKASISVNDLRYAFQLQKMLERDALYGSRYNEYLLGHFGVKNPDSRLQFTEYLGGGRIPIQIQTVAQTSEGTETSPQANLSGFSNSVGYSSFSKGFTEHGYIVTVGCIRQLHTYSQGIPKIFQRSLRNDFYDPLYANISEQPVYTRELYVGSSADDTIFGYNEAWAEYRYKPSSITGELRSQATNTLDIWHLGDKYASAPTLSDSFILENSSNIDRVLAVDTSSMDNFIFDGWFDLKTIRVMPVHSIPGLVDHH